MPFALLHRDGADHVEVLTGDVITVDTLADIPLEPGRPVLATIPYRQITERGFDCVDDGAPLECLLVSSVTTQPLSDFPAGDLRVSGGRFDLGDDEYGRIVEDVLRDEIGHGEGANFVIHRVFEASVEGDPVAAARAAFGRLLANEQGTYWTFLVHTGTRTLVGATPERHVSVNDGIVMMNPISGTFRHGSGPLIDFLEDPKEVEELYMVLDEELKMMATVAEHGGQVAGPYLKQMAHLTHTEYLLAGRGSLDVREVLRETMFAPTVTGSPIENACRVIARHEKRGRRYYAGVLALLSVSDTGEQSLDAPILIRTAEITPDGTLRVPVGATLVRHSTAAGEVAETHTKAAGILAALGASTIPARVTAPPAAGERELASLAARNVDLARFWLDSREEGALAVPSLTGRTAVIVDGEDTFTAMLAHQLKALGLTVSVQPWSTLTGVPSPAAASPGAALSGADLADAALAADLLVVGPGPGDPADPDDPKMVTMRGVVAARLASGRPLFAVCLGQQMLAQHLGLPLIRRDSPYQGLARDVDLFGTVRRVGFYSSFTAVSPSMALSPGAALSSAADLSPGTDLSPAALIDSAYGPVEIACDPADRTVHALRGPFFAGVQFHPESVLSRDGIDVLRELLPTLLAEVISPLPNG
ncbi:chorismate-binding protein [Actinoplanes palleronii]|uniref:anthranilate synthase n=1 Tax=Actinoplanes palleronii TaxID=113570 RepID=A0ABQ4BDD6_9ACTN|nr:chorismate-binding protein [Actinoplanes palleronii]GIE68595.1 phenazine-specific anthranilate synthase component I [Actinoplanes palleronii]